jgi:hypothetical protein
MEAALVLAGVLAALVALATLAQRRRRRGGGAAAPANPRRADSELHRQRAAAQAEVEEHDIDAMVDALNELRRRRGGREIGEELADELMRGTWDEPPPRT